MFFVFIVFFLITSYNTLLPKDKAQADAVDIGITIKPIPVRDNVIELDVVAIITNVSNDFSIVVIVLYFLYLFFDLLFSSLKYVIISLMLFIWLLKLLTSFDFFLVFVQDHYFLEVHLGIVYHVFGPFI